jgi:hypothetical protein
LQAFYSSSWKWLQPGSTSHNRISTQQQQKEQQEQQERWRSKDACSSFEPVELSALLTAACRLQLQPPSGWLAAVADSSSRQVDNFQQQELGLLLWGFARLQYVPPRGLLAAAAARAMQLGPGNFAPQTLSLLLYGMLRLLRWQPKQQQQQQQHGGQDGSWSDVPAALLAGGAVQLEHANALDLALLAWCLGLQAMPHRQQQQQEQGQGQSGEHLLPLLLQAATARLQQQQFTPQGLGMLLWGCGKALHAASASSSSSKPSRQQQQQHWRALPEAGVLLAFVEAASAAITPHAKAFLGHELSLAVWGLGAVVATTDQLTVSNGTFGSSSSSSNAAGVRAAAPAAAECLDLLSCQLLDASDQLSNYQLAAAIQGFSWAQHARGLDLLHLALQDRGAASRAQTAQPQELLLLLRACIAYKYVPEGTSWGGVLAAVERLRHRLQDAELAQMLYLLGKLQVQSDRRAKQRAAQAAAAAAAEAAAAASTWATRHEQRRVVRQQEQQRRQALAHVVLRPLVPDVLLGHLLVQAGGCVDQCTSADVSLMLWGVSHLQQHLQSQQRQPKLVHGVRPASSIPWGSVPAAPPLLSDQAAPLLRSVYPYTLQQLQSFAPGHLATLLYALHRLRARPEPAWLETAAMQFTEQRLGAMDGQSLAVLALALAGLNWVPPQAWLGAFVRAVAAADRRGVLVTTWQRSCITNSLAALNPLAGHSWRSDV